MAPPVVLRVFWCDVDAPTLAPPVELRVSLAMTVAELQRQLHAAHPARAPADDRVRLFARRDVAAGRAAAADAVGTLGFLSRPAQTLADAGLCAGAELYWASDIMRFQADPCAWAEKCNAAIGEAKAKASAAAREAAARAAAVERARFWAAPRGGWPYSAATGEAPIYYASEAQSFGHDGAEMGESLWLRLRCAGEEEGRFELHAHSWSDTGRKCRHTHALTAGEFRLAPPEPRACCGGAPAEAAAGAPTLWLMPTAAWGSSTRPPIDWADRAQFRPLPAESTSALRVTLHSADAITVNGVRLALRVAAE